MSIWKRRRDSRTSPPKEPDGRAISDDRAIELARASLEGKVILQDDGPITVNRSGRDVVVEFARVLPPGTRGGDYEAQVTLDGVSGEVRQVLGSS